MTSINVGPLAFPIAPLLVLGAWALAAWTARLMAPPSLRAVASALVGSAVWVGLVVARLTHVLVHLDAYRPAPWSMVDIRDGGWHAPAGVVAALVWLAWRARRTGRAERAGGAGGVEPGAGDIVPARRLQQALASGAAVGLVAWAVGLGLTASPPDRALPDVAFTRLDNGQATTLPAVGAGRPMVVNLWATWCAPCRAEMPAFAQAQRELTDVAFVFANQGETAAQASRFVTSIGLAPDSVLLDAPWALGTAVGSRSLPTTLFVSRSGRIVKTHVGMLNRAALQVEVDALRAAR